MSRVLQAAAIELRKTRAELMRQASWHRPGAPAAREKLQAATAAQLRLEVG